MNVNFGFSEILLLCGSLGLIITENPLYIIMIIVSCIVAILRFSVSYRYQQYKTQKVQSLVDQIVDGGKRTKLSKDGNKFILHNGDKTIH